MSCKDIIKNTALQINCTKKLDDITISEVAQRAGISRSTFYTYYNDVYSVMEEIENELLSGIQIVTKDINSYRLDKHHVDNPFYVDRQVFEFIQKNSDAFKTLLGKFGEPLFRYRYAKTIEKLCVQKIIEDCHIEKYQSFMVAFLVNGLIAIVEEWLYNHPEMVHQQWNESVQSCFTEHSQI